MFRAGVPEKIIQEHTGHRSLKALRAYQGVVTPIVRVGPFATGVKMQSRGQAGFLALVKRSRGLSGSVNGQDQLLPKPIPTRILILQATRTILSTLFISAG